MQSGKVLKMADEPRAYTDDEIADMIVEYCKGMAHYWANLPDVDDVTGRRKTIEDRCSGVAFSILAMLDGSTMELPAMTLKPDPHPDDKEFLAKEGWNWFDPDTEVREMLHERFYK